MAGTDAEYWEFLKLQYPEFIYEDGEIGDSFLCEAQSLIYRSIVQENGLNSKTDIYKLKWPEQIWKQPRRSWICVYRKFTDYVAFNRNPDPEKIDDADLDETVIVDENSCPREYAEYFGKPDVVGTSISTEAATIHENPFVYSDIYTFMERSDFSFMEEFQNAKHYYVELKARTEREIKSNDLFDD